MEQCRRIGRAVLEPERAPERRLEREQPVVVRVVGLERHVREVAPQPVDHREERVVVLVEVVLAGAVEPGHEVELEVADVPVLDGVSDPVLHVGEARGAPLRQARFVRAAVRVALVVGEQGVADRVAGPLRVLLERVRRRIEVERAHPQPELHRSQRLAALLADVSRPGADEQPALRFFPSADSNR